MGFIKIFACRYYKLTRIRIFWYLPLFLPIKLFLPEVSSFLLFGELPLVFGVGLLSTNAVLLCLAISWFSFHSWTIFSLAVEFRVDKFFLSAPGICCFISFWSPRDEKYTVTQILFMYRQFLCSCFQDMCSLMYFFDLIIFGFAQLLEGGTSGKELVRDVGLIPGSGTSPGRGHGNPHKYSCLENPTDRGAWWAVVRGIAKSQTWLKQCGSSFLNL